LSIDVINALSASREE